MKKLLLAAVTIVSLSVQTAFSQDDVFFEKAIPQLLEQNIAKWFDEHIIVSAIIAQNQKNVKLSHNKIQTLDKQWREETQKDGQRRLIEKVVGNTLSSYLKGIKEKNDGLFSEIFVMDNKGLNVGQSDVTTDYWQGDEAKWQKTYLVGPDAVHVGEVEYDESADTYQVQVSLSITDPNTKNVVGAITLGVDVQKMLDTVGTD